MKSTGKFDQTPVKVLVYLTGKFDISLFGKDMKDPFNCN
jgi:hypothetical protein